MNLEQLADLGEFIGGVAVLATLLYLAAQLRQANRMARLAGSDKFSESWIEVIRDSLAHTDLYLAGAGRYAELSPKERLQFRWVVGMVFYNLQNFHLKYRNGVMGADEWDQQYQILIWYLAGPGMRDWWEESSSVYSRPFAELVTSILDGMRDGTIEIPPGTAELYVEPAAT